MDRPAPFGRKGCVTPAAFASIEDETLKAEAVLIAVETGLAWDEVAAVTGLSGREIGALLESERSPFCRPEGDI